MLNSPRQVSVEDGGLYMCQINTDPMTSQSAWLNVMIPPDIDMAGTSQVLVVTKAYLLKTAQKSFLTIGYKSFVYISLLPQSKISKQQFSSTFSGHDNTRARRYGKTHVSSKRSSTSENCVEKGRRRENSSQNKSPSTQVV